MTIPWSVADWGTAPVQRLVDIERMSSPAPWSMGVFETERAKPWARGWVLTRLDVPVAGFVVAWRVAGEIQLANLAVDPAFRRLGGARLLLRVLEDDARSVCASKITLEVRDHNAPARRLYESLGFQATSHRPAAYPDGAAAVLMEKLLL